MIDQKRLKKQQEILQIWIDHNACGTIEAATGFGKTYLAKLTIERLLTRDPSRKTIVIVPTIVLKQQWEDECNHHGLQNVLVYVVNTIILSDKILSTDLLILDEIHRYASEEFVKVFARISYKFILGLTATLNRLDGKHELLEQKAPVLVTITQQDAVRENYISNFREYNLGIDLNKADRKELDELNKNFHFYFGKFGHDFTLAMACTGKDAAERYAKETNGDAKKIAFEANRFAHYMRKRKEFLYKTKSKLEAAIAIATKFNKKTVTFSESTDFADELSKLIPDSGCYHSSMATIVVDVNGNPIAIGEKVDNRTLFRYGHEQIDFKELGRRHPGCKKLGNKKQKGIVINDFIAGRLRYLHTAKALDQGFNVEDIELAIITSSTTNPTQHIQRVGRVCRKYTYPDGTVKMPIIVNIYIRDSQDEKWLRARQLNPKTKKPMNPGVKWIKTINEIQ